MSIDPIFINALIYASILTLLTIGFTLTYLISEIPNFAHGTFAGIGIFVTFTSVKIWHLNPYVTIPLAFILCALTSFFLYTFVLRTMIKYGASQLSLMITTIAMDGILMAGIGIYTDYIVKVYGSSGIFTSAFFFKSSDFSYSGLPGVLLVSSILTASSVIILHLILKKTRFGIALRASVENSRLASTLGVNVEFVRGISWFMTGGLAGMAGSLIPLWFSSGPDTGSALLLTVFAASIFGGLSSIYGAIIGGYLLGLIEILGNGALTNTLGSWVIPYRPLIPLGIMIILLLRAPYGIMGIVNNIRDRKMKR